MNKFHKAMRMAAIEEVGCLFAEFNNGYDDVVLHYFLGGSERFGYSNEMSDVDMFVHIKDKLTIGKFSFFLCENGFTTTQNTEDYSFADDLFHNEKYSVHILLMYDEEKFNILKNDYIKICNYLQNQPHLVKFICNMKSHLHGTKGLGRKVFNSLYSLVYNINKL